jgi:HEAT repeat protein
METIWPANLADNFERQMSGISSMTQSEVVQFCLLNLLAIVEDPRANVAISNFLETHHSNAALASMPQFIRAGSAPLLELICSFFDHPDLTKRIQAAALVAMLKKEEKALHILYDAYPLVDRPLKEKIVTIIGQIGSKDSIPFLMDVVYEPSQSMRILASSSLMQCIRS